MAQKVLRVDTVDIRLLKSNPPQLQIIAHGTASTPGWTNPQLLLLEKVPADGIYEFDFVAEPPGGIVPQVLVPISASFRFTEIPPDLKGVRINAATNSIEENSGKEEDPTAVATDRMTQLPYLETLLGIELEDGKMKIRVPSNGCTGKDSFKIEVIKGFTGVPPYIVEIYRLFPDYCKAWLPDGVVLEYDLEELGIEPNATFTLTNKFGYRVQ